MATANTGGGTPPPPPVNQPVSTTASMITWSIRGVLIFFLLLLLIRGCGGCNKSNEETAKAEQVKENILEPTLYSLPADGSAIYVWIENPKMYKTYPKGGSVKITTTSGRTYIDRPGVDIDFADEEPGQFKFQIPDSSLATGIEIWQ